MANILQFFIVCSSGVTGMGILFTWKSSHGWQSEFPMEMESPGCSKIGVESLRLHMGFPSYHSKCRFFLVMTVKLPLLVMYMIFLDKDLFLVATNLQRGHGSFENLKQSHECHHHFAKLTRPSWSGKFRPALALCAGTNCNWNKDDIFVYWCVEGECGHQL